MFSDIYFYVCLYKSGHTWDKVIEVESSEKRSKFKHEKGIGQSHMFFFFYAINYGLLNHICFVDVFIQIWSYSDRNN